MLIDSHAHLDMDDFDADRDPVIKRAVQGGVARIVTIGIDLASSKKAIEIAKKYDFIYATVGYHPHNADEADPRDLEKLRALASSPRLLPGARLALIFFVAIRPLKSRLRHSNGSWTSPPNRPFRSSFTTAMPIRISCVF